MSLRRRIASLACRNPAAPGTRNDGRTGIECPIVVVRWARKLESPSRVTVDLMHGSSTIAHAAMDSKGTYRLTEFPNCTAFHSDSVAPSSTAALGLALLVLERKVPEGYWPGASPITNQATWVSLATVQVAWMMNFFGEPVGRETVIIKLRLPSTRARL